MTAIAAAIEALFADTNLGLDAVYRAGGTEPGVPVRVIIRRPDRIGEYGETRIATETLVIDIRVSEIAEPASGDTIELDGAELAELIAQQPEERCVGNAQHVEWIRAPTRSVSRSRL